MLELHTLSAINAAVNDGFRHCAGVWSCTEDFRPAWRGDCKNAAALKLRDLILAGARPDEFVIWVTRVPGGLHAVLVQQESGLVLDTFTNAVEPRATKERYEAMTFEAPCPDCGGAARLSAALARR